MPPSGLHYFPVAWPVMLLLTALFASVAGVVAVGFLRFASASMGIEARTMLTILLLALIGSDINVPVAYLPEREVTTAAVVSFFGIPYVIPVVRDWPGTLIAVNIGGAVIPTLLSLYLLIKNHLYALGLIGVVIVALVCHAVARPVAGLGIAVPIFVPPVVTAAVAIILARHRAGALAYISGSLGTLIGADLMNLNQVQGLGAPIASIGGAGTFDGIFLTGLLAVLYAGFGARVEDSQAFPR